MVSRPSSWRGRGQWATCAWPSPLSIGNFHRELPGCPITSGAAGGQSPHPSNNKLALKGSLHIFDGIRAASQSMSKNSDVLVPRSTKPGVPIMSVGIRCCRLVFLLVPLFLLTAGCASGGAQPGASDEVLVRSGTATSGGQEQAARLPVQPGSQDVGERPGVAVLPFDNGGSFGGDPWDYEALGVGLQQMLITELSLNSGLRLVERSRLREILDELELTRMGAVDPGTAANVGRLVQARYVVVGGFVDADGTMRLDGRIVDVETSQILTETATTVQGARAKLLEMVVDFGVSITQSANLPPLPQQVVAERKALDYPAQAIHLYSRALRREERGDMQGMAELLRQLTTEFPQHIEGRQMLEQYRVGDLSPLNPSAWRVG
jgi:TolB-like protein